jgi:hypothetical protein
MAMASNASVDEGISAWVVGWRRVVALARKTVRALRVLWTHL